MWWQILVGIAAGVLLAYGALAGLLWRTYRHDADTHLVIPDFVAVLGYADGPGDLIR